MKLVKIMYLKRLKDLREDRDLTQTQIANFLHCDQSLDSKYERGERNISLDDAVALAKYYDVDLYYLLGFTSNPGKFYVAFRTGYAEDREKR